MKETWEDARSNDYSKAAFKSRRSGMQSLFKLRNPALYGLYIIDLKADPVTFNWGARRKSVAQRYPLVLQWIVVLQKQEEDGEDADYKPQIWTF